MKNVFKLRRMEDGLLLVSLIITTFLMFHISILIDRLTEEDKFARPYPYTVRMSVDYSGDIDAKTERLREIMAYLGELPDGNTELEILADLNDRMDARAVSVILTCNEEIPFLQHARKYADKGLYIGETLCGQTYERDGKRYLSLSGIPFEIAGVLENHWSGGVDRSIYLFWDECSEQEKNRILEIDVWNPEIVLNSRTELSEVYRKVSEDMKRMGIESHVSAAASPELENRWYRMYNTLFQGIAVGFCCVTCWAAALFWVSGIYKDLVIRRTFGYDMRQLALYLGGEMLKLEGIAFFGALLLEWIFLILTGDFFTGRKWVKICLSAFAMLNILVLAQLLVMLKRVRRLSIVKLLREEQV